MSRSSNPFPTTRFAVVVLLLASAAVLGGCPPPAGCTADDDCAANEICSAGACVDAALDAGNPEAPAPDAGPIGDAGPLADGGPDVDDAGEPDPSDAGEPDPTPGVCVPNNDGTITSAELPVVLDVSPRFTVGGSDVALATVDLEGTLEGPAGNQTRVWTFDTSLADDRNVQLGATAPTGYWFSPDFPTADYVASLDGDNTAFGAFRRDADALYLLGVASAAEATDTLLIYEPPVVAISYPLTVGKTFTSETSVSGTFEGYAFYTSTDTHTSTVTESGILRTFSGDIDVMRMRLDLEVVIPTLIFPFSATYTYVRHSFITECLGQVAFVASGENEDTANFTQATEVRRLGWAQ